MIKLSTQYYPLFEEAGKQIRIPAGQLVLMQGDQSPNVYLIITGRIRMFYIGENGKEVTYRIIGESQLVGESAFLSHLQPSSISAVTDTTLIACPVDALYPYMREYDELNKAMFGLLAENYTELCKQLRRLSINDSTKRVASYLVDLTESDNKSLGIVNHTLPYTQEELSVCLNLHRTTVARILSQFAKSGLVKLGYKKISVLDAEALRGLLQE